MPRALARTTLGLIGAVLLGTAPASAIPSLQLYIEGSSYDATTQTWTTSASDFDIWVIADGSKLPITDVILTAAVDSAEMGSILLTPTTTSLVSDPSSPGAPTGGGLSADGAIPQFGNGSDVPSHGAFGTGTSFYEWGLGDMGSADSPCGDFIDSFPTTLNKTCQINVYHVQISGYTNVHFDAFGLDGTKGVKAPFSHDAALTPEPGAALLFGLGTLLVAGRLRRR